MIADLATVLIATGAVGASLFVVVYSRSRWWSTPAGCNAMATTVVIAVVLGLAAIRSVVGVDFPARDWFRAGCYLAVNIVVWWRVVLLWAINRRPPQPDERSAEQLAAELLRLHALIRKPGMTVERLRVWVGPPS